MFPYEQIVWKNIKKAPNTNETPPPRPVSQPGPRISVKLSLNKDCRVLLKPSSKPVALVLSKLSDASYNTKSNEWTFNVKDYEEVTRELIRSKVSFEKIPSETVALAKRSFRNDMHPLKGGIFDLLMDFQREAVNFAINRGGRVLLADDMGLGKTIQALAIAAYYKLEFPLLIISPAALCWNWRDSVERFMGEQAVIAREKAELGGKITIISYTQAVNLIEGLSLCKFGVVLCDECHYLKSSTSKRTKLLLPILQRAARLVMISGTPATSRPLELYPILRALDKSLYPSFQVYGNRYCNGRKVGLYFDYKGCSNAVELSVVLEKAFMIRRVKKDVLGQLPAKFRRQILLDAGVEPRNIRREIVLGENPDVQMIQEYKLASLIKKEPVMKYLEGVIDKGVKCLVFAHHKEMLDALEEFCVKKQIRFVRIDGSTISGKRQALVDQFQDDEGVRVAVLSITACSTGLTLTAGKAVIFAELYWNPGTMLQAEDRIHRIGQQDSVDIHYLVAKNTIDEMVWPKIVDKLAVLESLGIGRNDLKHVKGTEEGEGAQGRLNFRRQL